MENGAVIALVFLWIAVIVLVAFAVVVQKRQKRQEELDAETRVALELAEEMNVSPERLLQSPDQEKSSEEVADENQRRIQELVRELEGDHEDTETVELRLQLVEAFLQADQTDMAVQQLFVLADLHEAAERSDEAERCYRRILELDEDNLQAQRRLGLIDDGT